jgi:putative ATP-binding cassette transporter
VKLLRVLSGGAGFAFTLSAVLGILSGVGSAMCITLVHDAIARARRPTMIEFWWFVGISVVVALGRLWSQGLLISSSQSFLLQLVVRLSRRMLATPLRELEQIGSARLLAALTDDVAAINNGIQALLPLLVNVTIVVSCFVHLGRLSGRGASFVAVLTLIAVASGFILFWSVKSLHVVARRDLDGMYEAFRASTDGVKELQLHEARRSAYLADLHARGLALRRHNLRLNLIYTISNQWFQLLFLLPVGVLVFVVPQMMPTAREEVAGYAVVLLFIMSPIAALSGLLQSYGRASTALDNIDALGLRLTDAAPATEALSGAPRNWQRIDLVGIRHLLSSNGGDHRFELGPIDLTIRRGEVLFVTGANGSGKTTLAKLVCGLYEPDAGEIRMDGRPLDPRAREGYRQLFSAVFTDFFLFDRLLGLDSPGLDARARQLLETLRLSPKVSVTNGHVAPLHLSRGQRKRIALLVALLESRDICVFDEWAADQDREYRETFYREILPALRLKGVTCVVISHDERYFDLADRLIHLDLGRVQPAVAVAYS